MATPIHIPLLNPNEPEALLAELHVVEAEQVAKGSPVCTLETTKSTAQVEAHADGYVRKLQYKAGDTVRAGDLLCYLAPSPDWQAPETLSKTVTESPKDFSAPPAGLRITEPALELARHTAIDLNSLPHGPLITETRIREMLETAPDEDQAVQEKKYALPTTDFDPTAIIVYGGGGHGKSVIDLLRALRIYRIAGIIDDGIPAGTQIMGLPVIGGGEALAPLHREGVRLAVNAVGGIGNVSIRIKVFARLAQAGFGFPSIVHPTAFVEPSASLSPGVQVFPHAYIGSEVTVGFGCILNTGSIVSHDCALEDYVNISPGAILAGGVQVGPAALIGMGATVNLGAQIGKGARIGNGATVKSDVPEMQLVKAGGIWPSG